MKPEPNQFLSRRRSGSGSVNATSRWAVIAAVCLTLLTACSTSKDPYSGKSLGSPLPDTSTAPVDGSPVTTSEVDAEPPSSTSPLATEPRREVSVVYREQVGKGWADAGWSPGRQLRGGPAAIDLGAGGGWLLTGPTITDASALEFRFRTERPLGPVIRVILGFDTMENVGREIRLNASNVDDEGWSAVRIPIAQLNPESKPFNQIRFAPTKSLTVPSILQIDDLVLTVGGDLSRYGAVASDRPAPAPPQTARSVPPIGSLRPAPRLLTDRDFVIDCSVPSKAISQLIYGIGWSGAGNLKEEPWELYPGANRWGGNPTSRFNPKEGNYWNTADDYFFRNVTVNDGATNAMDAFLNANDTHGVPSAVSVPTLGWVAKDGTSYSYPTNEFPDQQASDPDVPNAGNGKDFIGERIDPGTPNRTSEPSTPETVRAWVASQLKGRTTMYFLDNEPDLWNSTHHDVRPNPLGYDELLQNTIDYSAAIRQADPEAIIAGPSSWGWPGYFYSAIDAAAGFEKAPDRKRHGDIALLPWYLASMRAYEKAKGVKLLDLLDVHFYPQAEGIFTNGNDRTDTASNEIRLNQVRGLWDPTYVDESWINEPVVLIPRLRGWISRYAPGLGISIGEWNFGAENHMSGGLAVAEALGRFGTEGVTSAYYWTAPPKNSPAFWAFRAFRNYDGVGSNFQTTSISVNSPEPYFDVSLFASRSADEGEITMVLVNKSPERAVAPKISMLNCNRLVSTQSFTYAGGSNGYLEGPNYGAASNEITLRSEPYSITVLRARMR